MKKILFFIVLILAMTLPPWTSVQALHGEGFYLVKRCPSPNDPNICDILDASAPFENLVGGQIVYSRHKFWTNPASFLFESSTVKVRLADGSARAPGHIRWTGDHGLFTILPGSGSLEGLHAEGRVDVIQFLDNGQMDFLLTGTYHFEP